MAKLPVADRPAGLRSWITEIFTRAEDVVYIGLGTLQLLTEDKRIFQTRYSNLAS